MTDDIRGRSELIDSNALASPQVAGSAEHEVWDWLKRAAAEFETVRVANERLKARVYQLERLQGGADRLSEEELVAELPKRMTRALQSAQHVGQEIIQRSQYQAQQLLRQAKVEAEEIRHQAEAEVRDGLASATSAARDLVHDAHDQANELIAQAKARRQRLLADLENRRRALEQDIERLSAHRNDLLLAFDKVRTALEESGDPAAGEAAPTPRRDPAVNSDRRHQPESDLGHGVDEQARKNEDQNGRIRQLGSLDGPPRMTRPRTPLNILFIGSPDHFGSSVATLLVQHRLTELGIDANVGSAQDAGERRPLPPSFVPLLRLRGLHPRALRRGMLSAELLRGADLVVGMTRADVDSAVQAVRDVWPYAFTLREFVRRSQISGARRNYESLLAFLHRLHAERANDTAAGPMDLPADDDLDAEMNGRSSDQTQMERLVDDVSLLIEDFLSSLWPAEMQRKVPQRRRVFDDALA